MILQKIKDISKFAIGEYADLRPDIKNLILAARMRKSIAAGKHDKAMGLKLAKDFMEMDLPEKFTCAENELLARQILSLASMTSPEEVKRVQYIVNLNNNNLVDLFGI